MELKDIKSVASLIIFMNKYHEGIYGALVRQTFIFFKEDTNAKDLESIKYSTLTMYSTRKITDVGLDILHYAKENKETLLIEIYGNSKQEDF